MHAGCNALQAGLPSIVMTDTIRPVLPEPDLAVIARDRTRVVSPHRADNISTEFAGPTQVWVYAFRASPARRVDVSPHEVRWGIRMGKLQANGRRTAMLLILAGVCVHSGCVERRYTIRSDPPGATVVVNGEEIGPAPASKSFVYYGDREITLLLDGYETKTLIQPIKAPWWDNLFTEFFTENLVPVTLRDEREYKYQLTPAQSPPKGELRDRAESLRSEARVLPKPRRGGILGWLGF
jgi:PEGA domain